MPQHRDPMISQCYATVCFPDDLTQKSNPIEQSTFRHQNRRCVCSGGSLSFPSGCKSFKNRQPAFFYSCVKFFLRFDRPAHTLCIPHLAADRICDGMLSVSKPIGNKVRHCQEIRQIVLHDKFQHSGQLGIACEEVLCQLTTDYVAATSAA